MIWVFFDVLEIIPSRDRTLDEVRDKVVAAWTAAETEKRIGESSEFALRSAEGRRFARLARG